MEAFQHESDGDVSGATPKWNCDVGRNRKESRVDEGRKEHEQEVDKKSLPLHRIQGKMFICSKICAHAHATLDRVQDAEQVDEECQHMQILMWHLEEDQVENRVDGSGGLVNMVEHLHKSRSLPGRHCAALAQLSYFQRDPDPHKLSLLSRLAPELSTLLVSQEVIFLHIVKVLVPLWWLPSCWSFQSHEPHRYKAPPTDVAQDFVINAVHRQVCAELLDIVNDKEHLTKNFLPSSKCTVHEHASHERQKHQQKLDQIIQWCDVEVLGSKSWKSRSDECNCKSKRTSREQYKLDFLHFEDCALVAKQRRPT
mmetsp:Transcript_110117/g.200327  ORF Transcript_110117/g.200327 Transcript_110117/m.200327 type:complete len:311 (+) Transcript_110117:160-1092(+)